MIPKSRSSLVALVLSLALAGGALVPATAADTSATPPPAATLKRADDKAGRLVGTLKLDDATKAGRVKGILGDWYLTIWAWHQENDAKLKELWTQWNQARAVVPKDEFPAEVIAHQMDALYTSLKPAYQSFIGKLSAELTPEQVDVLKETWSRSPGAKRTYAAYLEIVPDLNDEQKKVIHDRMLLAREDAMLTDADKEIVSIFKRHKVKVEAYVGTLEWSKLHRAFANRGKEPPKPVPAK
jgi:hypothetical protein